MRALLMGVDVGTGSARAGLFDTAGRMLARSESPIRMQRQGALVAEYQSEQIWQAVCEASRDVIADIGAEGHEVRGLAFDATTSLVVRSAEGAPLPLIAGGEAGWDTFVWLDHRAMAEAELCTQTRHGVLDQMGGTMSPEMEIPKLLWLKRHNPDSWARAGMIFDLVDFLSWRATGSLARSQSSLACKWNYRPEEGGWPQDFLVAVGLDDLAAKAGIALPPLPPGQAIGRLSPAAAQQLGLGPDCVVATGVIDAHAGALGTLGGEVASGRLALVGGTSNSIIALARDRRPHRGFWGPFQGALLADHWLTEGGQSAAGALLDHVLAYHPAGGEPTGALHLAVQSRIAELRRTEPDLAPRLHVLPDFHGNRSPLGDPRALGVVSGLGLETDFDSLCALYWRAAVAIGLGLRAILEVLGELGYRTDALHLAGGHVRNPLLRQLYADATGADLLVPEGADAVLLGSAMLASVGAGLAPDLATAARTMATPMQTYRPDPVRRAALDRDFRIQAMMRAQREALDLVR